MYADAVLPSPSTVLYIPSFTGVVGGGADGNGYWGWLSEFQWNENLGDGNDQGYFCPTAIDTFTPNIPENITAGSTDCISLSVANSADNNATFSASYYVTYHDAAENITETGSTSHPIMPQAPFTSQQLLAADPIAGWKSLGTVDCQGPVTPGLTVSTEVTVSYTDSVSNEISLKAPGDFDCISAKYNETTGHTWSTVYKVGYTLPGYAYLSIHYFVAPEYTTHVGVYDGYNTNGYAGVGNYSVNQALNSPYLTYAIDWVYSD